MKQQSIAITTAIYGTFDPSRLRLSIESLLRQIHQPIQIIVSEENLTPLFKDEAAKSGITYIFNKPSIVDGMPLYNPGKIRNEALNKVRADLVYTNDADIIFMNPHYLEDLVTLLHKTNGKVLQHPPLRRLPLPYFDEFKKNVERQGLEAALKNLYFPNDYVASTMHEEYPLKVVTGKNGRIYNTSMDSFRNYKKNDLLKGWEPTIWFDVIHCGGTFATRKQIDSAGWYSESYFTWGYEDSDFQWKLSECFGIEAIPRDRRFEVLHLDHDKNYFSKDTNIRNQLYFEERKRRGFVRSIEEDQQLRGEHLCKNLCAV